MYLEIVVQNVLLESKQASKAKECSVLQIHKLAMGFRWENSH